MGDFNYDQWLADLSSYGSGLPIAGVQPATQFPVQSSGNWIDWFNKDAILGKNGQQGWGNLAIGAAQGLGGLFMGMQQYGLAKDSLNLAKDQFAKNYAAQKQTINTQLEDRQRARVAAAGGQGNVEAVDSYLARNRIQ